MFQPESKDLVFHPETELGHRTGRARARIWVAASCNLEKAVFFGKRIQILHRHMIGPKYTAPSHVEVVLDARPAGRSLL